MLLISTALLSGGALVAGTKLYRQAEQLAHHRKSPHPQPAGEGRENPRFG